MAAAAINFEFHFNGHNSVSIAYIRTQFGTETKNNVPETELTSYFTSEKSKMRAAAILKIGLMAISRPLRHIFARNFIQGLKTIPHKPFCRQNSIPAKSKMAATAILKFTLTAITRSLLHIFFTKFGEETKNKVPETKLSSYFTSEKFQDGGGCHFESGLMAISRPLRQIFARNFIQGLKTIPH